MPAFLYAAADELIFVVCSEKDREKKEQEVLTTAKPSQLYKRIDTAARYNFGSLKQILADNGIDTKIIRDRKHPIPTSCKILLPPQQAVIDHVTTILEEGILKKEQEENNERKELSSLVAKILTEKMYQENEDIQKARFLYHQIKKLEKMDAEEILNASLIFNMFVYLYFVGDKYAPDMAKLSTPEQINQWLEDNLKGKGFSLEARGKPSVETIFGAEFDFKNSAPGRIKELLQMGVKLIANHYNAILEEDAEIQPKLIYDLLTNVKSGLNSPKSYLRTVNELQLWKPNPRSWFSSDPRFFHCHPRPGLKHAGVNSSGDLHRSQRGLCRSPL